MHKHTQINTVEAEDISVDNRVHALPTIQFFKSGEMLGEFKGSDINSVDRIIRDYVAKCF